VNLASIRKVKVKFGDFNYWNLKVIVETTVWSTVLVYVLPRVIDWLYSVRHFVRYESITKDIEANILVSEVCILKSNRDNKGVREKVQTSKVFVERQRREVESVSEWRPIRDVKVEFRSSNVDAPALRFLASIVSR